jgi:hypothetical protein
MSIVGDHPESGVRFVLERPYAGGPPWIYAGHAFTPDARFPLSAEVAADGAVRVRVEADAPAEVAEKARLVLRALYKQSQADGDGAPPRKIVRWRGEK